MQETILKAVGVSHTYRNDESRRKVLDGFALELGKGEFVALMGPSGSGKSTFLHLASGLIVPDSGSIEIAGVDVARLDDSAATKFRRRNISLVFQSFNLIDSLTVMENIELQAKLDGAAMDRELGRALLGKLQLEGKENKSPLSLSGGERQRVAIARALYAKTPILFADEPTGNLDAESARNICGIFRELNKNGNVTILLVTHDPVVAASATRVEFLKDGRIAGGMATGSDAAKISAKYLEFCR